MKNNNQPSPLLTEPIPFMIRKIGIPVSVGAIFNTIYNVVDTIYGGLISDQALAALSLSFPIYFLIIAVGFGFGQGTTALIGNSLGRGDEEQAKQRAVQTIVFGVISSLLLTVAVILSAPTLVGWMGATEPEYQAMALAYINPIFYGAICFITLQMVNSVLNALGNTKPGRNVLIAGFFLNLVLDPWFIFGGFGLPAMGIAGIAWATVLTQGLGSLYLLIILSRTDMLTAESVRKYWLPDWAVFKRILEQGLPSALDTLGVSLGFFMLTVYVSQFGQKAVAAFGAGSRLEQIALLPQLGLNIAVVSLVARNNGAKQYDRVQETWRTAMLYGAGVMLTTMILVSSFARPLMRLFTSDPEIIDIGTQVVQIRNLGLIPNAIFFMSSSAMRGIERPIKPLILNMMRFLGLPWLFIILLVTQLGYGLTSIWISSTAAFFIAAVAMYFLARRELPKPD
ncbi:MAG: MATE family efflux transporter [Anaerolineae bacterium]